MLLVCRVPENLSSEEIKKLYLISEEERRIKADKIRDNHRKAVSLTAGLLKKLLEGKYGFKYTSVSHSGDYAVCMGSNKPCGCDIEKAVSKKRALIERVCTQKELYRLEKAESKETEFIKIWTEKEASFKAGIGESMFALFKDDEEIEKEKEKYDFQWEIIDGYVITTCEKLIP